MAMATECSNPRCNCHFGVNRLTTAPTDVVFTVCRSGKLTPHDEAVLLSCAWAFHDQTATCEAAPATPQRRRLKPEFDVDEKDVITRMREAANRRIEQKAAAAPIDRRSAASGERSDDD